MMLFSTQLTHSWQIAAKLLLTTLFLSLYFLLVKNRRSFLHHFITNTKIRILASFAGGSLGILVILYLAGVIATQWIPPQWEYQPHVFYILFWIFGNVTLQQIKKSLSFSDFCHQYYNHLFNSRYRLQKDFTWLYGILWVTLMSNSLVWNTEYTRIGILIIFSQIIALIVSFPSLLKHHKDLYIHFNCAALFLFVSFKAILFS